MGNDAGQLRFVLHLLDRAARDPNVSAGAGIGVHRIGLKDAKDPWSTRAGRARSYRLADEDHILCQLRVVADTETVGERERDRLPNRGFPALIERQCVDGLAPRFDELSSI